MSTETRSSDYRSDWMVHKYYTAPHKEPDLKTEDLRYFDDLPGLYMEERETEVFRGEWMVFRSLRVGAHDERLLHWQRARYGAVGFDDRIFCGPWVGNQMPKRLEPNPCSPESA